MSWILQTLSSSIGRKLLMAITGIFLILFLVVHVSGNLLLLKSDNGESFNLYANFMTSNPLIKTVAYVNYAIILLHIGYAYFLSRKNDEARPIDYKLKNASENSSWNSRNMGILGTILFVFLVIHLQGFWWEYKFGNPSIVSYDGLKVKNMYSIVVESFSQWWYSLFYVISMLFVSLHLWHGFKSIFQTLGLNHVRYTPLIEKIGMFFSIIVPSLFAIIPIWIYFNI